MKIKYVTLTGADDNISVPEMIRISERYSYVEWGILFSQSKAGVSRYPSYDWVVELLTACKSKPVNLSAHLCGKWVDDVMHGQCSFLDEVTDRFNRIQLNMAGPRLVSCFNSSVWDCDFKDKSVMIGGPFAECNTDIPEDKFFKSKISPLYDSSGGKGIAAKSWPAPISSLLCGYAGGLNVDNLLDNVNLIENIAEDSDIWIDMESSLRDKQDNFDLFTCEKILEMVKPWI